MRYKKRALISVYDKTGIVEFAKRLRKLGYEILSSGGTAKELRDNRVTVTEVADYTGYPEMPGGLVKTIHPKLHAGILAHRDDPAQMRYLRSIRAFPIDLVVCNLYPFLEQPTIDNIDIGGPAMVRAAAKSYGWGVTVIVDPADYSVVINALEHTGAVNFTLRRALARTAFGHTAAFDAAIVGWFDEGGQRPETAHLTLEFVKALKYGENPWQAAALYTSPLVTDPLALSQATRLTGKPGYVNCTDFFRMRQTITRVAAGYERNGWDVPFIAIGAKHGNPCGAAVDMRNRHKALKKMLRGSLEDIHGGMVVLNFPVDEKVADILLNYKKPAGLSRRLLDGIWAPSFTPEAVVMLKRKDDRCAMLASPALLDLGEHSLDDTPLMRQLGQDWLIQSNYSFVLDFANGDWQGDAFTDAEIWDTILAWAVNATSNSNTITLVADGMLIGNGVGQQSRVGAAKLAVERALHAGHGAMLERAVSAGDAYYPFKDGVEELIKAGVMAHYAPHGSVNDKQVHDHIHERGARYCSLHNDLARVFSFH